MQHVNTFDRDPLFLFVASDEPTLKMLTSTKNGVKAKRGKWCV